MDIEHDTIAEAPGSAVGLPVPPKGEESEAAARRRERRAEAGMGDEPWCSVDNDEIWTVVSGDADEE